MGKHHLPAKRQTIEGVIRAFNISPKGSFEGVLLDTSGGVIQVNFGPDAAPGGLEPGRSVVLEVEEDHHAHKHPDGDHPVFLFVAIPGRPEEGADGTTRVSGTVQRLNYARHGEPNGVVLNTGDFIHLKPDGMKRHGLTVGQSVTAAGEARPSATGHRVIEASMVNGNPVESKKPHKH
jgi:hypothetical protein